MQENGLENISRDKEKTGKVPLMFCDDKMSTDREQLHFCTLATNKQVQCMCIVFKNLKISSNKDQQCSER